MGECFTLCQLCDVPIGASEDAHQFHDLDCDRALTGVCRCDGWVCMACCPDPGCTPLAAVLQEARAADRARVEAWEAAQTVPASTEGAATVPAHPLTGFYFG